MKKKRVIGIIPARGGSKGIKNKNLIRFKNKPLIYWSILAAKKSKLIDDFYVSTDSEKIKRVSINYGSKVINRPKYLAKDNSKTLDVLKHAIEQTKADVVVVLQPTSPHRPRNLIDNCLKKLFKSDKNSLATGRYLHIYPWGKYNNLSRQNLKGWFWDDGLLYILNSKDIKNGLWCSKKKICVTVSKKFNLVEIDDYEDLKIIKKLTK